MNIQTFFIKYTHIRYERGERIIRPNELTSYVIFIKSGIFKIHKEKNGRETIINILNASSYDGLIFGIKDYIRHYTISALTEVEVVRAPKEEFLTFLQEHPEGYTELSQQLSQCLETVYNQMNILKSGNAYYKIASIVSYLAKETGTTEKKSIKLGFRITHQMIANLTGLTRETVTVQLNKLKAKNYIEYEENMLKIKNLENLAKLIEVEG
jgi:CRP-like cAMP-binding protein